MLNHKSFGRIISSSLVLTALSLGQAAALAQAAGGTGGTGGTGGIGGAVVHDEKTVGQALAERRQRNISLREAQPEAISSMYVLSQGNKTISLRNGKVESITVAGKEIPVDRAAADGNDVVVNDENGKEIARFTGAGRHFGESEQSKLRPLNEGELPQKVTRLLNSRRIASGFGDPTVQSMRMTIEAPKVMLGISMAKPSPELAGHLGIKANAVTLVNFVHKDTPAAKAGLQQFDLLTRVKVGSAASDDAATPEKIRELMRDAKPGDEVEFKVIQRGAEKTMKLKLIAYDETRLADGPTTEGLPGEMTFFGQGGLPGQGVGGGAGGGAGGAFGGVLTPMPGQGGGAAVPGMPPMPPMPRDMNDQQAWREYSEAVRGMGDRFKENGGNPFIIVEPWGRAELGGDPALREVIQRLEQRLDTMEQALRDLKVPVPAEEAPAGDGKDAAPKKDKKQGAARGSGTETRAISDNAQRVIIGMPQSDSI